MSQDSPTQLSDTLEEYVELILDQVDPKTPDFIVELMATHYGRAIEARNRIDTEGIVVRDLKGSVIQHPAIKIEQDATKLLFDLFKKYAK